MINLEWKEFEKGVVLNANKKKKKMGRFLADEAYYSRIKKREVSHGLGTLGERRAFVSLL